MNWELGAAGLDLGHLGFPAGLVQGAALAEFAAREDGAADDHDEGDDDADDRADVRLAAVVFTALLMLLCVVLASLLRFII